MSYDPFVHRRRSIRLKGYDYTQPGAYFVTIVTHNRARLFGDIVGGEMRENAFGDIARAEWLKTADIRCDIELDEFIIMPNHIHAIVAITCGDDDCVVSTGMDETNESRRADVGARRRRAPTVIEQFGKPVSGSIPTIIRAYKSAVTARINQIRGTPGAPVWQRNYYEHIVRNENDLSHIREYIQNNPIRWEIDGENYHNS